MAVVSHINRQGGSRSRTLDRLARRLLLLFPGQVPFFKGSSRSGNTEPCCRFSVETETQAGRVDVEPSDGIPDLESVWQSGGRPLRFSSPPVAECLSVRVSANKADSGSTMQSKGEQCPSPSHSPILALPDLVL